MSEKMTIKELREIMENGIANWAKPMENPFMSWYKVRSEWHGHEVATYAIRYAIENYGTYHPYRGGGNVSYHEIVFKTPITQEETDSYGWKPSVSVRLTYWQDIMLFSADGSGCGGKTPWAKDMRLIMDRIEEAVS